MQKVCEGIRKIVLHGRPLVGLLCRAGAGCVLEIVGGAPESAADATRRRILQRAGRKSARNGVVMLQTHHLPTATVVARFGICTHFHAILRVGRIEYTHVRMCHVHACIGTYDYCFEW